MDFVFSAANFNTVIVRRQIENSVGPRDLTLTFDLSVLTSWVSVIYTRGNMYSKYGFLLFSVLNLRTRKEKTDGRTDGRSAPLGNMAPHRECRIKKDGKITLYYTFIV